MKQIIVIVLKFAWRFIHMKTCTANTFICLAIHRLENIHCQQTCLNGDSQTRKCTLPTNLLEWRSENRKMYIANKFV